MLTLKTNELFDLSHTLASELLGSCEYPWHVLPHIKEFVIQLGRTLSEEGIYQFRLRIWYGNWCTGIHVLLCIVSSNQFGN